MSTAPFHVCTRCGARFASRNKLFRHLASCRPSANPANATDAAKPQAVRACAANGSHTSAVRPDHCLWLGDLPRAWSRAPLIQQIVADLVPDAGNVFVDRVVRKAYRIECSGSGAAGDGMSVACTSANTARNGSTGSGKGETVGYAVVCFATAALARRALGLLDGSPIRAPGRASADADGDVDGRANGVLVSGMAATGGASEAQPDRHDPGEVRAFVLRARPCVAADALAAAGAGAGAGECDNGRDGADGATLEEQLRPLTTAELHGRAKQLHRAAIAAGAAAGTVGGDGSACDGGGGGATGAAATELAASAQWRRPFVLAGGARQWKAGTGAKSDALALAMSAYRAYPRPLAARKVRGHPLPAPVASALLHELCELPWPARSDRPGVSAEGYLCLHTSAAQAQAAATTHHKLERYARLRALCRELMQSFIDPDFFYSCIAVTKNFRRSAHRDEHDQTFQYAVSLGTFQGGELCIDCAAGGDAGLAEDGADGGGAGGSADAFVCGASSTHGVVTVDTRNAVAKVDGRHVHWVRPFSGGDRYSLIFFDTTSNAPTAVGPAVDTQWRPHAVLAKPFAR